MSKHDTFAAHRPQPGRAYIIEVAGGAAGIVAYDSTQHAYGFYAADPRFLALETGTFASPAAAEKAARALGRDAARPAAHGRL